jgi:hypothetical protein
MKTDEKIDDATVLYGPSRWRVAQKYVERKSKPDADPIVIRIDPEFYKKPSREDPARPQAEGLALAAN